MQKRNFLEDIKKLYDDFKNAKIINDDNLFKILKDNAETKFGKKYYFDSIKTIDEYRKSVPLTTYDDYVDGNEYVYEVGYRLATSGTLGKQKKYTVSKLAMDLYGGYNYEMPFYLLDMNTEKGLHISVFRDPNKETLLSCALYDHLLKNGYFELNDYYDHDFLFSDTKKNIPYIKMYIALAHKDIRYFDSIFLYDLLLVFKYFQNNWEMMLNDIKTKSFSVDLRDDEKQLLLKQQISQERIQEIENVMSVDDKFFIKKLFPDLRFVSGVGGGKYKVYDDNLKEIIGNVDIYYYIFAQTECTMGVPIKMNEDKYAMMPRTCFYEYLDLESNSICLPYEVVIGKFYEPIVTTFSGLYRYHTGDKVRIEEFVEETPVVSIHGRINSIINIAGEKVDDADISLTMETLKNKYEFNQFCIGIDDSVYPNRYVLFVESNHVDEDFTSDFDLKLKEISYDYLDLRNLGAIGEPVVKAISTERFSNIQKGQIKPKVIITNNQVKEWINE